MMLFLLSIPLEIDSLFQFESGCSGGPGAEKTGGRTRTGAADARTIIPNTLRMKKKKEFLEWPGVISQEEFNFSENIECFILEPLYI